MTKYDHERALHARGIALVAGVDEAGRGPLAGPVAAGAVILDPDDPIDGIDDSKKLSAKRREELAVQIKQRSLAWAVAMVSETEIDSINIYEASRKAMTLALAKLSTHPGHVLSDAMPLPGIGIGFTAIIHGDALSDSIGAASILAKVARDEYMVRMDALHPGYGFARHKGYPTPEHLAALDRLGPCPIHRRTYEPVRAVLRRQTALDL
ncbi:MAG: ribonuclease HII [Candidatus Izemoplasmatales bacterium]